MKKLLAILAILVIMSVMIMPFSVCAIDHSDFDINILKNPMQYKDYQNWICMKYTEPTNTYVNYQYIYSSLPFEICYLKTGTNTYIKIINDGEYGKQDNATYVSNGNWVYNYELFSQITTPRTTWLTVDSLNSDTNYTFTKSSGVTIYSDEEKTSLYETYEEPWTYSIAGYRELMVDDIDDRLVYLPFDNMIINQKTDDKITLTLAGTSNTALNQARLNIEFTIKKGIGQTDEAFNTLCNNMDVNWQYWNNSDNTWSQEFPIFSVFQGLEYFGNRNNFAYRHDLELDNTKLYIAFGLDGDKTKIKFNFYDTLGDLIDNNVLLRSDIWEFNKLIGFVDANGDEIDDRTQDKDDDTGEIITDDTGINHGDIANIQDTSFSGYMERVGDFFKGIWSILPPEINVLIIAAVGIITTIAIKKAALG